MINAAGRRHMKLSHNAALQVSARPANETAEPATLERGQAYQSATWRVRRMAGHIEVTDLRNAGKRGWTCARFTILAPISMENEDEVLSGVAAFVLHAVKVNVSTVDMAQFLADVTLCGLRLQGSEPRGCDVDRDPEVRFAGDLARGWFSPREFSVTFTWILEGGARHDVSVGEASRQDAAKAYMWAKDHAFEVAWMSRDEFCRLMDRFGVRCR